jgi:hypothetical protein
MLLCFIVRMQLSMALCPPIPETRKMASQLDGVESLKILYIYIRIIKSLSIFSI